MTDRENRFLEALKLDLGRIAEKLVLALFHACDHYYNFIESDEDSDYFDMISTPLLDATCKTWKRLCEIWESTK